MGLRLLMFQFLVGLALAGCTTTLQTARYEPDITPDTAGPGYYLPRQTVSVEVVYQLEYCPIDGDDSDTEEYRIRKVASMRIRNGVDGAEHYRLDYPALSSGLKTTDVKLETYANGTIKSIGATVDDRTAEVVGSVMQIAAKVVTTALTGTLAEGQIGCLETVKTQLNELKKLRAKLKDPEQLTDEEERAAAVDALNRLEAFFTIRRTFSFTPTRGDGGLARVDSFKSAEEVFTKWFDGPLSQDAGFKALTRTTVCVLPGITRHFTPEEATEPQKVEQKIDGSDQTVCDKAIRLAPPVEIPTENGVIPGVVYRDPAGVTLVACNNYCVGGSRVIIGATRGYVSQLGVYRLLQLSSSGFQDRNLAATFTEGGRLSAFNYGSAAALDSFASTAAAAVTSTTQALEAVRDREINEIKRETELLEAKASRIDAQTKLDGLLTPTESIEQDTVPE